MSAPSTRTGSQARRRSSATSRLLGLLLGLVGVVAVLVLMIRLTGSGGGREQAEATASPAPSVTAIPTVSPEPTPALPAVDLTSWELRLINLDNPLGEDYAPPALTLIADNEQVDSRVAPALNQLFADAKNAGYPIYFCSGYRDYDTQYSIYWNHINNYTAQGMTEEEAKAATLLAVQYPGCSEHQSGLCADILESPEQDMEPYIGGSGLMLWLEQNCARYGFVVRYPEGKTDVTGVEYEPWHLRYVGEDAARYMMEHGLCLEEFVALYNAPASAAPSGVPMSSATAVPTPVG